MVLQCNQMRYGRLYLIAEWEAKGYVGALHSHHHHQRLEGVAPAEPGNSGGAGTAGGRDPLPDLSEYLRRIAGTDDRRVSRRRCTPRAAPGALRADRRARGRRPFRRAHLGTDRLGGHQRGLSYHKEATYIT